MPFHCENDIYLDKVDELFEKYNTQVQLCMLSKFRRHHEDILRQAYDNHQPKPAYHPQIEHLLDIIMKLKWTDQIMVFKPYNIKYDPDKQNSDADLINAHSHNIYQINESIPTFKLIVISTNDTKASSHQQATDLIDQELNNIHQQHQVIQFTLLNQHISAIMIYNTIMPVIAEISTKALFANPELPLKVSSTQHCTQFVFNVNYVNDTVELNPAIYQRALSTFNQVTPENMQKLKKQVEPAFAKRFPKPIQLNPSYDSPSLDGLTTVNEVHKHSLLDSPYCLLNEYIIDNYRKSNTTNDVSHAQISSLHCFNPIHLLDQTCLHDIPDSLRQAVTKQINSQEM